MFLATMATRPCGMAERVLRLALTTLLLAFAWGGVGFASQAGAKERAQAVEILAVRAEKTPDGGRVLLEVSRAVSFDARVLAEPWRLEMLVPGARTTGGNVPRRLRGDGGLIAGFEISPADGGVRLSVRLNAPALITDAHAVRGDGGSAAQLAVALARTDARTLARLLGEGAKAKSREPRRQVRKQGQGRPAGPLEKIKAAYRKLVEEAAAPSSIDELLNALPARFDTPEEEPEKKGKDGAAGEAAADATPSKSGTPAMGVDADEKSEPATEARPGPAKGGELPVIVVDAGHGGHDPGAIGIGKVREKDVVLRFARILRKELAKRGYRVIMTRDDDRFLRLRQRVKVARKHHARLFVSIHADKFRRKGVRGLGVYTLSERASDAEAAALAKMENAADLIGAPDDVVAEDEELRDILVDLVQRETNANSLLLARELVRALRQVTRLRRNPVRSAPFRVLRAAEIPSLLIELGYMSNPHDVRNLVSRHWQAKVAARMARTIDRFLKTRLAWR